MSTHAGPNTIKSGLVFHLDASNPKSYPGTGTTWYDLSGNNNHGTLTNMSVPSCHVRTYGGRALDFDGNDDYVMANQTSIYQHNNIISIGCWVKAAAYSYRCVIVAFGYSFELWYPLFNNDTTIGLGYPGATPTESVANSVKFGQWAYVYATRSGASAGSGAIWLNGERLALKVNSNSNHPPMTVDTFVGTRNISSLRFLGSIDDVRVYNRALSQAEIQQNYNATRGRFGL